MTGAAMMRASDQKADAGLDRKREALRERIAKAIYDTTHSVHTADWPDAPKHVREICFGAADAVIAVLPEPHAKKERGAKLPTDECILCAMRSEFISLVRFIEANADHILADRPLALAQALRNQGVV